MRRRIERIRTSSSLLLRSGTPLFLAGALLLWSHGVFAAEGKGVLSDNWRFDVGTSMGMWGLDQETGYPYKAGRGTIDVIASYQIYELNKDWTVQAGVATGTVVSSESEDYLTNAVQKPVAGPIAGLRYAEMVSGNLFFAHFTDGTYWNVDQYALGIMLAFNPHELVSWAIEDEAEEIGPPAPPVSFLGATPVTEGIWKRGY